MSENLQNEIKADPVAVSFDVMYQMAMFNMGQLKRIHDECQCNSQPKTVVSHSPEYVEWLESELEKSCDVIKMLASLYESCYITLEQLMQSTNIQTGLQPTSQPTMLNRSVEDDLKDSRVNGRRYIPKHSRRVLSETEVIIIKNMMDQGVGDSDIAKQYNVDSGIISSIRLNKTYKDVEPTEVHRLTDMLRGRITEES